MEKKWVEIDLGELIKDVVHSIIARTTESIEKDYPELKPVKIHCPLEETFAYAMEDGIYNIDETRIRLGARIAGSDGEIH